MVEKSKSHIENSDSDSEVYREDPEQSGYKRKREIKQISQFKSVIFKIQRKKVQIFLKFKYVILTFGISRFDEDHECLKMSLATAVPAPTVHYSSL